MEWHHCKSSNSLGWNYTNIYFYDHLVPLKSMAKHLRWEPKDIYRCLVPFVQSKKPSLSSKYMYLKGSKPTSFSSQKSCQISRVSVWLNMEQSPPGLFEVQHCSARRREALVSVPAFKTIWFLYSLIVWVKCINNPVFGAQAPSIQGGRLS